jgi:hypothetical protein
MATQLDLIWLAKSMSIDNPNSIAFLKYFSLIDVSL